MHVPLPPPAASPGPEQRVFDAIRAAVVDHRLAPGTKLKELELAQLFGVSRAAARAALGRLAHLRLVEQRPNRGAVVATPSPAESRQLFEARRVIEEAIATKAAEIVTVRDAASLHEAVADEEAAYARGDERAGLRLSLEFHRLLARVAGNEVLARYLDELMLRTPLIALAQLGAAPSPCGCEAHAAIASAVAARDGMDAARLMREHLEHLEHALQPRRAEPARTLAEALGGAVERDSGGDAAARLR